MALTNLNTNWVLGSYFNDRDYYIKSEENPFLFVGQARYLKPYYDGSMAIGYGLELKRTKGVSFALFLEKPCHVAHELTYPECHSI